MRKLNSSEIKWLYDENDFHSGSIRAKSIIQNSEIPCHHFMHFTPYLLITKSETINPN